MKGGSGSYARAIERCWSAALGRAVVLSPREWTLINDWYERAIPLGIVEETIEQTLRERSRRGAKSPRGLGYIAPAVEEAWSVVLSGRRGDEPAAERTCRRDGKARALDSWRRCIERAPRGSPLRRLLEELLRRGEGGADPAELERTLEAELASAVDAQQLHAAEREADRQLAGFARRMEPGLFESTRQRAVVARLRRELDLREIDLE